MIRFLIRVYLKLRKKNFEYCSNCKYLSINNSLCMRFPPKIKRVDQIMLNNNYKDYKYPIMNQYNYCGEYKRKLIEWTTIR